MNIFLTGGTGFIGSHVTIGLLNAGHKVTVLARNRDKIPALNTYNQITIKEGDLKDEKLLENSIPGHDAVILIALNYSRAAGYEVLLDDTLPTVFISDIAARSKVKHLIYTSSTAANDNIYMVERNQKKPAIINTQSKQHPATFYGATKAASENFLLAQSYLSSLRINIIRPGYTFGNPVVAGAPVQADTRFKDIVDSALKNKPIDVIKNDGIQFIRADDLSRLYQAVLKSEVNRKTYFALSKTFISWEAIAREVIHRCNSSSSIRIEDRAWSEKGTHWDVSDMKNDFGLEFDGWPGILEHIDYYKDLAAGKI